MVRINVSAAAYDEIRQALIKEGNGGVIVERSNEKTIEMGDVTIVRDEAPAVNFKKELERAYRCIRGLYGKIVKGETPDQTMLAYHSPTLAAAIRYVDTEMLDGSDYFTGKHIDVLRGELAKYMPGE